MAALAGAITGARLGWNYIDMRSTVPRRDQNYGDWAARIGRYQWADLYINNLMYEISSLKSDQRMYKWVRPVENPLRRENELISSYTFRGQIDTNDLTGGAIPLKFDNKAMEEPLKNILKWSNLPLQQNAGDAAKYGDSGWWGIADPASGKVRLELVDPYRLKIVDRDEVGNVKAVVFEYECYENPDVDRYVPGRTGMELKKSEKFIKTIIVTKEKYRTYKDGKKFAFYTNERGQLVDEWDNIFGFVPLKLGYFAPGKDGWGQNSFFGIVRRQIDELNNLRSITNDSIVKTVEPLLKAKGIAAGARIDVVREEKDSITIAYLPNEKADLESLTIPLDLAGAGANYQMLLASLERNMPILALQKIRDIGGNLSGVAIENMFGDAISIIGNTRKNLYPALTGALQMVVTMGAVMGIEGFGAFNIDSYDRGEMELSIAETPIIDDKLSRVEKIDKIVSVAPLPVGSKRKALIEIGYTKDDAETIIADDKAESEEKARQAIRAMADSAFGEDEDEDETVDTEDTAKEADTKEKPTPFAVAA